MHAFEVPLTNITLIFIPYISHISTCLVSLESMFSPYKSWTHNCQEGSTIESIEMDSDIKQADLAHLKSIEDVLADLCLVPILTRVIQLERGLSKILPHQINDRFIGCFVILSQPLLLLNRVSIIMPQH